MAVVGVALLLALPLAAQAPPFDPTKPDEVAKAYLDACEKWDAEAALRCLNPETDARDLRAVVEEAPKGSLPEQLLTEMLLYPLWRHVKFVPGELTVEGDTARLPVVVTVTLPQTLILRKDADGKWVVDLRQSITSSTGLPEPEMLRAVGATDCLSNLKQLAVAALMWAQDHDEVLPPAANWGPELLPYLKNDQVFRCPEAPELACGYAYNLEVAGRKLADIAQPAEAVLFYESTIGRLDAADKGESQPQPGRHQGANNLAYVDGHAKWLGPAEAPPPPPPAQ
jgi:prepilin-type processing-associated H-X9-DG protein